MHDESAAYLPIFKKTMASPRILLFLTEAEKTFSNKLFAIQNIKQDVISVGIEINEEINDEMVLSKFKIKGKYIIYVGRVEASKGCNILLDYFIKFIKNCKEEISLVLAGKNSTISVSHPQIIFTGFVSDYDKTQLIKQAQALVIPSKHESLSLVLLESFACKIPVIANAQSEVLEDHINKSNGGWVYQDYNGFNAAMIDILRDSNTEKGLSGFRYIKENYTWEKVIKKFDDTIDYVIKQNKKILVTT